MSRMIRFRLSVPLCASLCLAGLALLVSCAPPPATADLVARTRTPDVISLPTAFFPRQKEEPNGYMQALLIGDLVLVDGCLRIGGADGALPIWPWNFTLQTKDDAIQVVDGDGRIVAQVGDRLRMSGGEAPAASIVEDAARPLLDSCRGPYWIVGNEIERVAVSPGDSPSPSPTATPTVETVALSPTPSTPGTATPTTVSSRSPSLTNIEGLIAFVDPEGRLCLLKPDGRNLRQLTASGEAFAPAWSPDGETLAYIYQERAGEPRRATLYRLDGGHLGPVGAPEQTLRSLAWSPDGHYLLLDSGTSMAGRIEIVQAAAGETVHQAAAVGFAWSPDGQRLALGQLQPLQDPIPIESGDSVSLAILEIGTHEPRVILTGTSEVLYFPRVWLPDGRLRYDRLDWDESTGTGEYSQWTVTVDRVVGTPEPVVYVAPPYDRDTALARLPETFQNAATGSFSWSPDGRWLVFHTRLAGEMGIYVFDWEQGGDPVRLVDGASPAWRPAPTEPDNAMVRTGTLDCTAAGTFSHCVDDVLGIELEVPTSWGEIEARLRPGLDSGFAYDYYFGGKTHAETEPLLAGGRSLDFSEGRGAMPTDFAGYGHAGLQKESACDVRWNHSYPICRQISSDVAWMVRLPTADVLCEGVFGDWTTAPVFRIEVNLPDNPTINGFVFEAPFFSDQFADQVKTDLYPLLGIQPDAIPRKCDKLSRQAFDAQLMALLDSIMDRSADAQTLENVDELVHLAESVAVRESTAAPPPTWRHILFVYNHDGATELWTIDPASGQGQQAIRPEQTIKDPALSPSGETIAYVHSTGDYGGVASELWLMDRDGAHPRSLYVPPPGQSVLSSPAWSPDGQEVYFRRLGGGTDDQLLRIPVIGGEPTVVLTDCLDFALSPDGQWLVSTNLDRQLGIFWPDGSRFHDIEPQDASFTDYYSLAASPDGRLVAFQATEAAAPGEDAWNLYVMEWSGRGVRRLTDLRGFYPTTPASGQVNGLAWTADGAHLVYSVDGHPEQSGIWRISLDGGKAQRLFAWQQGEWAAVQGSWHEPGSLSHGLAVDDVQSLLLDYSQALSSGRIAHQELYSPEMQELIAERRLYYEEFHQVALHSDLLGIDSRYKLDSVTPDAVEAGLNHVRATEVVTLRARYRAPTPQEYTPTRAALWALARTDHPAVREALQGHLRREMSEYLARVDIQDNYETVWIVRHHFLIEEGGHGLAIVQDTFDDKANDNPEGTDVVDWVDGQFVRRKPDLTLWPDYAMYHEPLDKVQAEGRRLLESYTRRYGSTPAPDLHPGWLTYTHPTRGFSFRYPPDWEAVNEPRTPNIIRLRRREQPGLELGIGFRWPDEEAPIQRTGVGAGEVEIQGTVHFLGRELSRDVLIYEGKVNAVLYNHAQEIDVDGLVFTLSLDDHTSDYEAAEIEPDMQVIVDEVVASFLLPSGGSKP